MLMLDLRYGRKVGMLNKGSVIVIFSLDQYLAVSFPLGLQLAEQGYGPIMFLP